MNNIVISVFFDLFICQMHTAFVSSCLLFISKIDLLHDLYSISACLCVHDLF